MKKVRVRAWLIQWSLLHCVDRSNWNHNDFKFLVSNAQCSFWNWNHLDFRNHTENLLSSRTAILMYRASRYRFGVVGLKSGRRSTEAGVQLWAQPARLYGLRGAPLSWCCGEHLIHAVMCCVLNVCAKTKKWDFYNLYTTVCINSRWRKWAVSHVFPIPSRAPSAPKPRKHAWETNYVKISVTRMR